MLLCYNWNLHLKFFQSQTPFVQTEIVPKQKYFTPLIFGFIWSRLSSGNSSILSIFRRVESSTTTSTRLWQECLIKRLFYGNYGNFLVLSYLKRKSCSHDVKFFRKIEVFLFVLILDLLISCIIWISLNFIFINSNPIDTVFQPDFEFLR